MKAKTLKAQISAAAKAHQRAKKVLASLQYKADLAAIKACRCHTWEFTGEGRHGSDKGDRYEQCTLCDATRTNGKIDRYQCARKVRRMLEN